MYLKITSTTMILPPSIIMSLLLLASLTTPFWVKGIHLFLWNCSALCRSHPGWSSYLFQDIRPPGWWVSPAPLAVSRIPFCYYHCPLLGVHSDYITNPFPLLNMDVSSKVLHSSLALDFSVLQAIFQRNAEEAPFCSCLFLTCSKCLSGNKLEHCVKVYTAHKYGVHPFWCSWVNYFYPYSTG